MSDFRQQLREHYDAASLPAEKVDAILARGRDAANSRITAFPRKRRMAFISAAAAAVVLAVTGTWWLKRDVGITSYAALPPRVIGFFQNKPDLLPPVQDKTELRNWLVAKGAPADMEIPANLLPLESAACQVLDVQGAHAYLSCYWRENKPDRNGSDLIHLLVANTTDFYDQPKATTTVREMEGWSFASWTKGDVIYTLATATSKDKLLPYLSDERRTDKLLESDAAMLSAIQIRRAAGK